MSNNFIKKKRVFKTKKEIEIAGNKLVKNPNFSKAEQKLFTDNKQFYQVSAYIELPVYETIKTQESFFEYQIICAYCASKVWKKSAKAKYCCNSCRNMANRKNKKNKATQQAIEPITGTLNDPLSKLSQALKKDPEITEKREDEICRDFLEKIQFSPLEEQEKWIQPYIENRKGDLQM